MPCSRDQNMRAEAEIPRLPMLAVDKCWECSKHHREEIMGKE